jgi:hypothetical protein
MPRGHEILTERALNVSRPGAPGTIRFVIRGRQVDTIVSPAEVTEIIEGNREVDVATLRQTERLVRRVREKPYLPALVGPLVTAAAVSYAAGQAAAHVVHSTKEADQKQHALRRTRSQDWRQALQEIVEYMRALHRAFLSTGDARTRLRRIGAALHLIQDSYCPAHTDRSEARCLRYIRNYGGQDTALYERSGAGREHRFPTDPRDNVHAHPGEARNAVDASQQYLQIAFKVIYATRSGDIVGKMEAERDFERFVQQHFRPC